MEEPRRDSRRAAIRAVHQTWRRRLQLIAKTWVEQGVVKSIPGLWWPNLLLALLIVGLIWNWPGPAQQRATTTVSRG